MVSNESWAIKIGTMYLVENVRQNRRRSVTEKKKCTVIAFVSSVIIVEDKGEYLRVIECTHKNNIKFGKQDYQNMDCMGGENLILTTFDPLTNLPIKEYEIILENSTEILEWMKAFEFWEEEKQFQDSEYIIPVKVGLLDTGVTNPTYEVFHITTYDFNYFIVYTLCLA
ncbi:uncharacterized protein LOC117124847 [Anneissia japonica]|uniref:uncharacterized protein LOC117124847 n=1 Tax=Anneissia japonica TaxID=1529436 RepID=UPI0014255F5F|nr:uncharacterized protein LOC117124847 [Anneissia japonica]